MDTKPVKKSGMSSRRSVLTAAGAVAGTCVLGGLGWRFTHPTRALQEPDGQPRSLVLSWPSPEDDPVFIVAQERGFFSRYNLEITARPCITGQQAIDALSKGEVVGAAGAALSWLPRLHEGVPAMLVAGLSAGTFRLLVRKNNGITKIDNVVGKKIAVLNEDYADQRFFSVLLRRKGINPSDVLWRSVSEDRIDQALDGREVDGVVLHDPDGWQLLSENQSFLTELAGSTTGNYAQRVSKVFGLSNHFLSEDPKGALAVVLALRDACRWIEKHRDETAQLLSGHIPDMNDDDVKQMLAHQPAPVHLLGHWLRDQMAQYADELKLIDLLPNELDSGVFSRSICQNVLHI
ncbi:ABC transporter substrate-binding protein [Acetobacter sp.]|jgi:NitT/TauT family transport system substrate-binding protein|uniref:ABC transporter substrate-binding protein n=1 Tax=Acetobacter sp. TaxID=440 RepID=UPI0025B887AD|nr:ABC transporter substrate-binding protein [Acetobacter sp.]MCH4091074.1 ABC transporter substrate-binding protein [Acetobacter sp.]MCI1300257.1 ABC transporter substrate-binding protein [Acetobacter sp.]MCI1316075.1 ABC transporter substrate-binding protein [Acetobacter sp.]